MISGPSKKRVMNHGSFTVRCTEGIFYSRQHDLMIR
jgi:hypothetical protein